LQGAVPLLPYQDRWVRDRSSLKIAVKARQTGYSFVATLRAVTECLLHKMTWVYLSKGERQSRLAMEKVTDHLQAMGIAAKAMESTFFEGTLIKQLEVRFPNGSVIYGLPANPDTARGYSGNVTLDEFAFHTDSAKIYTALFPTITRGYSIEVISTPNGQQGKFYDLAKEAGLVEGVERVAGSAWSPHSVDIYQAVEQGLKIDIGLLRKGVDDEESWQQEYCCQFVSTAENFMPPELLALCIKPSASVDVPLNLLVTEPGEFFLGIDIGRRHDLTVFWLDRVVEAITHDLAGREVKKRIATARHVRTLRNTPFADQLDMAREILSLRQAGGRAPLGPTGPLVRRACIDATGMGAPLAESLNREFGPRVEPVTFTQAVKEDMAFRTKRLAESGQIELPDFDPIRRAFAAVKKTVTAGGSIRFDAERTEAGHADEFWAKALADLAADMPIAGHLSDGMIVGIPRNPEWIPEALPAEF